MPSGRHGHTATYWKDGKLIIFGGEDESGSCLNDLYVYDIRTETWSQPVTHGIRPRGRSRHAACLSESRSLLYISGGIRRHKVLSDIFCIDLDTMTWSSSRPFVPRYDHAATAFAEKVWIFGGLSQDMDRTAGIVWFDLSSAATASLGFTEDSLSGGERADDSKLSHSRRTSNSTVTVSDTHIRRSTPGPDKRIGTHLYAFLGSVVVDITTNGPAARKRTRTSISCFDMVEMRWRSLADQDSASHVFSDASSWSYVAFTGTTVYLLGSARLHGSEDVLFDALHIDLRYFGLSSKHTVRSLENVLIVNSSDGKVVLPPGSLNADMETLLEDNETADFTITAFPDEADSSPNGEQLISKPILVHTVILLARWEHFRRLLNTKMREYHGKSMHIPEKYSTVCALIYYIYTDTVPFSTDVSSIARLLVMSNMYALPRLRDICIGRIQDNFDAENAALFWQSARMADESVLRTTAARFCLRHWGRVVRSATFKSLSKSSMVELCEEIDIEGQVVGGQLEDDGKGNNSSSSFLARPKSVFASTVAADDDNDDDFNYANAGEFWEYEERPETPETPTSETPIPIDMFGDHDDSGDVYDDAIMTEAEDNE